MRTCTIVLLLAALPALASAESYLCVEEQTTGFRFDTGTKQWQQSNFRSDRKFLVKPNTDPSLKGKWIVWQSGEFLPYAWSESDFTSTGALKGEGHFGEFAMNRKSLRFLRTYVWGYWTDAIPGEPDDRPLEEMRTPQIGIGTCTLEP